MKTKNILYLAALLTALVLWGCHSNKAEEYEGMSDAELLEVLDIKLEHSPKDADLLVRRAQVLMNMGRPKDAAHDLNRAAELKPKQTDIFLLLADAYFAAGNVENSYKSLTTALELEPNNKEVLLKQGEITFYSRDYDRSLQALSKVTEQEPNNRTALFMKGFIYKEKGDTASAVTLLRRVCDIYPDYAPAFEELGIIYASVHNPLCVDYLATVVRLEPNNTNALYALAMYNQEIGEYDAAEQFYHNILDINEHSADAWHNLGWIELTFYSDYERAIEYFDHALAIDPNMQAAIDNKALAQELKELEQKTLNII